MKYFYKENAYLQDKIEAYFADVAEYNARNFGGQLSIILLGSLSRGEATWIQTDDGVKMVSDIEFFTVYPKGFDRFSQVTEYLNSTAKTFFADQDSTLFHIDNTFVCRSELPKMERKLLTYDAKHMGKTVVGTDDIELLPEITLDNINLFDIRDILTHRIFSVLYYGLPVKSMGKTEEYRYSLAKNSLDLMTVMMVCYGQLASGFINRLAIVKNLPIDSKVKDYFEYCLSIKLCEKPDKNYTTEQMEEMFLSIVSDLSKKFKVPLSNILRNIKHIVRRSLGIVKRAVIYRRVPRVRHLNDLIKLFREKKLLCDKEKQNNLILNGYPV